ncbi:DUF6516 family protein [Ramlibacter sp. 2FC]|uniref:toxin-antitoxin system TumE family protein n=1 Tax=Ramlibacter sp. 2FC TaxID=2502188 RepID=UPI00201E2217|nr:DUF6516 family protein [Ramlibacter sp. 2FC]
MDCLLAVLLHLCNTLLKCNTNARRANCKGQGGAGRRLGGGEIVIWRLPQPLRPCTHFYKYRLYFGADGHCRVRYDNERGKGDHRHLNGTEESYSFVSLTQLLDDFQRDVETWS